MFGAARGVTADAEEPLESFFQALAEAERIKPVCEAQIDVDDFKVPIPIPLEAGGAVHEPFAACWTVPQVALL